MQVYNTIKPAVLIMIYDFLQFVSY